jgi:hypothetical protein
MGYTLIVPPHLRALRPMGQGFWQHQRDSGQLVRRSTDRGRSFAFEHDTALIVTLSV